MDVSQQPPLVPPGLAQPLQPLCGVAHWPAGPERAAREGLLALGTGGDGGPGPAQGDAALAQVLPAIQRHQSAGKIQANAASRLLPELLSCHHGQAQEGCWAEVFGVFHFWEQSKHGCWDETPVAVGPPGSCRSPRWLWDTASCGTSGGTAQPEEDRPPTLLPSCPYLN